MVYLTTADPLTSGLTARKIYDKDESYEKVLFCRKTVPITTSSIFTRMEAGPDNTHYDSWWGQRHSAKTKL